MKQEQNSHDGIQGIALAAMSGVIGTLAFPDRGIWPMAFFIYTPLFLTLFRQTSWKQGFLRGWVAGIVLHLGCYYWVYHTMISMSDLSPLWATVACILFCLYSGLQQGLFGALVPWVLRRSDQHALWMIPVLFAVVEFGFPHVFPWYLGNVLFEVPLLTQTADLFGVHGNTVILVFSSLLGFYWLQGGGSIGGRRKVFGALLVMWCLVAAYGALRLSQIDSTEAVDELRVGLVQANITPADKKQKGVARGSIYDKGVDQMKGLEDIDLDLIVWPEGGYPYYFPTGLLTTEAREKKFVGKGYSGKLQKLVKERGVPFAFGALTKPEAGGKLRNSFVFFDDEGFFQEVYYKRILVPFGEYIPFSDWFPFVKGKVKGIGDMAPGTERALFQVGDVQVLPSICYEAIYPAATRHAVMQEPRANVILNITNDMWFGDTSALDMHLMVQVSRAVELRVPLIRSTNSGITVFVDAGGRIRLRTPRYEALSVHETVQVRNLFSLYSVVGDIPLFTCFILMLGRCFWGGRRNSLVLAEEVSTSTPESESV